MTVSPTARLAGAKNDLFGSPRPKAAAAPAAPAEQTAPAGAGARQQHLGDSRAFWL